MQFFFVVSKLKKVIKVIRDCISLSEKKKKYTYLILNYSHPSLHKIECKKKRFEKKIKLKKRNIILSLLSIIVKQVFTPDL